MCEFVRFGILKGWIMVMESWECVEESVLYLELEDVCGSIVLYVYFVCGFVSEGISCILFYVLIFECFEG